MTDADATGTTAVLTVANAVEVGDALLTVVVVVVVAVDVLVPNTIEFELE